MILPEFTSAVLLALIHSYGYALLFPISVIEGPIITLIAGSLVSFGLLNPYGVFAALFAGDIVGDICYYGAGRYGRGFFIEKIKHMIGITDEKIARIRESLLKYDWQFLLAAKTQPIGSAVLFSAGVFHMSFFRFITVNIIISIPKTILLLSIGYYFSNAITNAESYVRFAPLIPVALIGVALLARWAIRRMLKPTIG